MRINYHKFVIILFYIAIFIFLLFHSLQGLDNDFGWHLKVGEEIYNTKQAPLIEHFDYTLAGREWVDHEWLTNLIIYLVFNHWGYFVLNILFALIILAVLLIQAAFVIRYFSHRNPAVKYYIMIFQIIGVAAISPHIGVRVQEITILFTLLTLVIIYSFEKDQNAKILFWLTPLFCLWANMHAGYLLGIFLLLLWGGCKTFELIIDRTRRKKFLTDRRVPVRKLLIFYGITLLSISATLINPYGWKLYGFLSSYSNDYYLKVIAEWLPFYSYPIIYSQLIYAALVISMLLLALFFKFEKKPWAEILRTRVNIWQFMLIVFFFYISWRSRRNFPLFYIASFPLLISLGAKYFIFPGSWLDFFRTSRIVKFYFAAAILLVIFNYSLRINFVNDPFSAPTYCRGYPCAAIEFIRAHPDYNKLKIYNDYGWGGFLIYVWPEKKLFIDGRLPQYEFNGHSLLEEYLSFKKEGDSRKKLDEYGIDLVLYKNPEKLKLYWWEKYLFMVNEDKLNDNRDVFRDYLLTSPEWQEVFADKLSRVFVRSRPGRGDLQ